MDRSKIRELYILVSILQEPENMEYLLKQHEEILKYYGADGINRPNVNYVLRLQHAENWRQALTARERGPCV